MISADNIYKFRSRISKNLYSDMHNTKGNLVEHINIEINEKVDANIEYGLQNSYIKIFVERKSDSDTLTDIINIVDKNLRKFILTNKDKLQLSTDEEIYFNEFIGSYSLYEFFIVGNLIQFEL